MDGDKCKHGRSLIVFCCDCHEEKHGKLKPFNEWTKDVAKMKGTYVPPPLLRKPVNMYVLNEAQKAKSCSAEEWRAWNDGFDGDLNRVVGKTKVGGTEVSTIFLGIDHSFNYTSESILFETLWFDSAGGTKKMDRHSTFDDAVAGHDQMVKRAKTEQKVKLAAVVVLGALAVVSTVIGVW